jgi:hypothetical protein
MKQNSNTKLSPSQALSDMCGIHVPIEEENKETVQSPHPEWNYG